MEPRACRSLVQGQWRLALAFGATTTPRPTSRARAAASRMRVRVLFTLSAYARSALRIHRLMSRVSLSRSEIRTTGYPGNSGASPAAWAAMGRLWPNATPPLPPLRFAELYAAAVGRLADTAPVNRIGALHTLESLGQAHPGGRPAIVDVLCAYLRTPPPAGTTEDDPVRATAQQILAAHLRPGGPGFW